MAVSGYEKEQALAIVAVRKAARLCANVQARLTISRMEKDDRSPVTVADYGSQALVCRQLREAFPDDPIVAEEDASALRQAEYAPLLDRATHYVRHIHRAATSADVLEWIDYGGAVAYSDRFWTLDPIDGTKGFLRGEQYAVALALIIGGQVQVAALACPNLSTSVHASGCIFVAERGRGAVSYPLVKHGDTQPVRVSGIADCQRARFCESVESAHSAHGHAAAVAQRLGIIRAPRRLDSQAKYAVVARGDADIYLRLPTRAGYEERIWDHAAGVLIMEEAGGLVTDIAGRALDFTCGATLRVNSGVVATNGHLHDAVLAALKAVADSRTSTT